MVNFTMLVKDRLRLTQQSLISLSLAGMDGMNVTILDDGSDHDTRCFLEGWCHIKGARLVRNDKSVGTGKARNQVIKASEEAFGQGEYLYLSDNDVYFYPTWLPILINCYQVAWANDYGVVGAYNHPYHQPGDSVAVYGHYVVREVMALALQSMLMDWGVWNNFGPFKETPAGRVCMGEDVDFGNAIRSDGLKLGVVTPALLVNCGITNSCGDKIPGWDRVSSQAPSGVVIE